MLSLLLTATLQGLAVLIAVWALLSVFRGMAPSRRQALWWIACLKFPLGLLWIMPIVLPVLPRQETGYEAAFAKTEGVLANVTQGTAGPSAMDWTMPFLALWALGTLTFLIVVAKDARHLRRLVRQGKLWPRVRWRSRYAYCR